MDLGGVLVFAAGGEDGEVGEDVILGVATDPRSVRGCVLELVLTDSWGRGCIL